MRGCGGNQKQNNLRQHQRNTVPLQTSLERSIIMQLQTSSTPLLTAAALAELIALGRNRIS
ncbi:MAG: hypothetical protein LUC29_09960, partial [Acidaminococcaceae bacterium]|nr:hypothetical protein [Acidaminococcaceae bacterium]